MVREIPGYRYDPGTQRYYKIERNATSPAMSRSVPEHRNVLELANVLWKWREGHFQIERSDRLSGPSAFLASSLPPGQFRQAPLHATLIQAIESPYPILWSEEHPGIGLYFHQGRGVRHINLATNAHLTPVFPGNRILHQSNHVVRASAFRNGLLICSFEDCLEDLWEACFVQFTAVHDASVIAATEFGFRRDLIDGAFQSLDISPCIADHVKQFLIAIDSKLILGQMSPTGLSFPSSHAFREIERITSVKFIQDGKFAFVSCTGGSFYLVSIPSLRPVNKIVIEGTAVKSIIGVEERKATVITFHEHIIELDFSTPKPERSPHQLNLAPFKDLRLGDFTVIPYNDHFLATQIGSNCISEWSWAQPSRPVQAYHIPEHEITHISAQSGDIVTVLYK